MPDVRALLLMCLTAAYLGTFTPLQAGQWWETKNHQQWSVDEAKWVLDNSPWTASASAGVRFRQFPTNLNSLPSGRTVPVFYRIRLFTARPIREASLRLFSLGQIVKTTVDAREITHTTSNLEQQASVEKFLERDDKYIIIAVALTLGTYGSPEWIEKSYGDELSNIDFAKLMKETKLTTSTGKTASLFDYEPPDSHFGARFYFPRNLPDGQPLVTSADKELLFETWRNDHRIRVKFKLRKMLYRGKLEM
jgi:hypothetical protein